MKNTLCIYILLGLIYLIFVFTTIECEEKRATNWEFEHDIEEIESIVIAKFGESFNTTTIDKIDITDFEVAKEIEKEQYTELYEEIKKLPIGNLEMFAPKHGFFPYGFIVYFNDASFDILTKNNARHQYADGSYIVPYIGKYFNYEYKKLLEKHLGESIVY